MVLSAWTIWLFRFMGFRAKSGTEWTGYSLDCYDYWSNCGAENDSFSFMSRYVCPVLVSFLAISATLIVTVSILYWNYSETMYVLIITIITPGTQVPRYLLLSNLFRPRYRRATKKSTVLDHWGKKVHFLVNLFGQWILNMSKSTSCDQVLLKLCSSPAHRGWMFFLILVQSRLRSCKKNCTFSTCNQGLRICAQVPTLALLKFYSRLWKALLKLSSSFTHVEFRALYSSSTKVLLRALKSCTQVLKSPKKVVFKFY